MVWNVDDDALRLDFSRWTLVAALLLHMLPLVFWLWQWGGRQPAAMPVIAVTLVPPPAPAAKPNQSPALKPRESGPENQTEAKKTATPRAALPTPHAPEAATRPGTGTAVPKADEGIRNLAIRLPDKGGDAARNSSGDAYLNRVMGLIERNRVYPDPSLFVAAGTRTPVYSVGVEPSGRVTTITLLASSGVPRVDEAARQMIADSAPFPPLPPDYPPVRAVITIFIPVYPRGGA